MLKHVTSKPKTNTMHLLKFVALLVVVVGIKCRTKSSQRRAADEFKKEDNVLTEAATTLAEIKPRAPGYFRFFITKYGTSRLGLDIAPLLNGSL